MHTPNIMRIMRRAASVMIAAVMLVAPYVSAVADETGVPLDAAHFPDEEFRTLLKEYDFDGDDVFSQEELYQIDTIVSFEDNIKSVQGIEYFPVLRDLNIRRNQISSIDVSHNPKLEYLIIGGNQLTSLDVSHNPALKMLNASRNQLTSIDLSQNTALKELHLSNNQLASLDLTHNTKLKEIYARNNALTELDLALLPALEYVYLSNNQLTSVGLGSNSALIDIELDGNRLTSVDVSGLTAMDYLNLNNNLLTSLDVSKNAALTWLDTEGNQLTSVEVSHNEKLLELFAKKNRLLWLSDFANPEQEHDIDLAEQLYGPVAGTTLNLTKTAPGIDVTRISNVQGGTLDGDALTATNPDGLVTYDYQFNGKADPLHAQMQFDMQPLPDDSDDPDDPDQSDTPDDPDQADKPGGDTQPSDPASAGKPSEPSKPANGSNVSGIRWQMARTDSSILMIAAIAVALLTAGTAVFAGL